MASQFSLEWKVDQADHESLLRDFLKKKEISRTALTEIKYKGGFITVNHQEVNVRFCLKAGDCVKVVFPLEIPSPGMEGENRQLEIIYEDDWLLIINKPPGMSTIPSREHPNGSLANALIGYYQRSGISATTHIVTRLDRDTSGLVLVAKHSHVHHLFSKQQRAGGVRRIYEAFAEGMIEDGEGTIEEPIARKEDSIIEREVNQRGQYACTHYQVLTSYPDFSHVQLQLETGRTHQIRVHMSYIGHPLLGDDLYGGQQKLISRQALHCREITFLHPLSHKEMHFYANLPEDMKKIIPEGKPDK